MAKLIIFKLKIVGRVIFWLFISFLILIIGAFIAIQTPYVQTKVSQGLVKALNEEFGTKINIGKVSVNLWGDVVLKDVEATDHHGLKFIKLDKTIVRLDLLRILQNQSDVVVKSLVLNKADIDVITYKGEEDANFIKFIDNFATDDDTESNFRLRSNVTIRNSSLSIINDNLPDNEKVWLDSKNFNADIASLDITTDEYAGKINSITFKSVKNGENYEVKNLESDFLMNQNGIFFSNLDLVTQSSDLKGSISLNYNSLDDFSDVGNKVVFDFDLKPKTKFAYKDLRYFVPDWKKDEVFELGGKAKGTLNDLNLSDFEIKNGQTSIKTNRINLSELFNGNYAIRSNGLEAETSYEDLKRILPNEYSKKISDFLKKLGKTYYKGSLNIDDRDLRANGSVKTALGNGKINISMYDYTEDFASYKGNISTSGFDLNKLVDVDELGKVSGDINFSGKGYLPKTMRIATDGELNYLDLNKDRYKNIAVNGELNQQKFSGILKVGDEKVRAEYNGVFDFSSDEFKMDFESDINHVDLKHFGLTESKNTWLKAKVSGNASFSDLNDLASDLKLENVYFQSDTLQVNVPNAQFQIENDENNQKHIKLDVPEYLDADIEGEYKLEELVKLLQNGAGNFLVEYEKEEVTPNQRLKYNIKLSKNLLKYFISELDVASNTHLVGEIDNKNDFFELNFISPQIKFKDYIAHDIQAYASTSYNHSFRATAEKVEIDGLEFKEFKIQGRKKLDTLVANATFKGIADFDSKFDLNFYQTFESKNVMKMGFSPSFIQIDNQVWNVNPLNKKEENVAYIDFENNNYRVNELLFQSENQYLRINGDYKDKDSFSVKANIENVSLAKIIPSNYMTDFHIEGIANGQLSIVKKNNEIKPESNLKIDSIMLNNKLIGNLTTEAKYDVDEEVFNLSGSLDRDNINTLYLSGLIDNKGEKPQLDLSANLDDFSIGLLSVFLEDIMSDWEGTISGDLLVKGDVEDPDLNGILTANDVSFRVVYLGTTYKFHGENDLLLNKKAGTSGYLTLPDISFTETASKTQGEVDGLLIFSDLSNWFLDLDFSTDKLLVLNTSIQDNELFYGKVFGKGTFSIYGPATDLEFSGYGIDALQGSVLNLNTGGTKKAGDNNFIQFYSIGENGEKLESEDNQQQITGFSIDMEINADPGSTVNLILDEKLDNKVEARGYAKNFKIKMNKAGKLYVEGEYVVDDGIYNYKEGIIIDKDFQIQKGGYLRFNGNPYNASMNLKAIYSRNVNNIGSYLGINYTQPVDVDLVIGISGDLENTEIDLGVEVPTANNQISSMLKTKISSNIDERVRQVGSIMVLGKFDTSANLTSLTATDAATASAFELLGKSVGGLFSSIIPGLEINPTYLQSSDRNNRSDVIQAQFNLAINNRLKINGAVGTPLGTQYNEQVTTNVQIDYDISKKGNGGLVLRGFSRPSTLGMENFNVNSTFSQSYGGGLVYRKSFDSIWDLFIGSKDKEAPKQKDNTEKVKAKKELGLIRFK